MQLELREIDQTPNATDEEKAAAKAKVDEAAQQLRMR